MKIRDLFTMQGRVSRAAYTLTGMVLTLIKHNIDRVLAMQIHQQSWGLMNYLTPLGMLNQPYPLSAEEKRFLVTMALVAVPFIWAGVAMTVKRLRDAGVASRLVFLFFIPAVNVVFFLLLCLLPSREDQEMAAKGGWGILETYLPNSKWGSGMLGTFAGAIFGTVLTLFSIRVLGGYGFTLFLAIPFFMGYFSAWLHCYRQPRSFGDCAFVAILSVVLTAVILVGIAIEGIFCILMGCSDRHSSRATGGTSCVQDPGATIPATATAHDARSLPSHPFAGGSRTLGTCGNTSIQSAHGHGNCGTAGSGVAKNCGLSTNRRAGALGIPIGDVISTRGPHGRVGAYCGSPVHFFDGSVS